MVEVEEDDGRKKAHKANAISDLFIPLHLQQPMINNYSFLCMHILFRMLYLRFSSGWRAKV